MGKKILIVEDNELNRKLYFYTLKSIDAEFSIAVDGYEALDKIRKENPDLVILDIQIPGISGIEVIKEIRKEPQFKNLMVVAVTAYSMQGDMEKILAAGCNHYVSKPINTREFPILIKGLLEKI